MRRVFVHLAFSLVSAVSVMGAVSTPARAATVDLALVLAVDMSGSIDAREARLQRQGYVQALTSREVVSAISGGPLGRIVVTYIEWSDMADQRVIVDWTLVKDLATASSVAAAIESAPFRPGRRTALGEALMFSMARFKDSPYKATRRVIDVSGDGRSNVGLPAWLARNKIVAAGITINGLPILSTNPRTGAIRRGSALDDYYLERVVGGAGAFVIAARNFRDFGRAIRQKLLKEIALNRPGTLPGLPGERRPAKNGIRPTLPAGSPPAGKKSVPLK